LENANDVSEGSYLYVLFDQAIITNLYFRYC
jgi:hypothetical protein